MQALFHIFFPGSNWKPQKVLRRSAVSRENTFAPKFSNILPGPRGGSFL